MAAFKLVEERDMTYKIKILAGGDWQLDFQKLGFDDWSELDDDFLESGMVKVKLED